jgi:hypothetical protein
MEEDNEVSPLQSGLMFNSVLDTIANKVLGENKRPDRKTNTCTQQVDLWERQNVN